MPSVSWLLFAGISDVGIVTSNSIGRNTFIGNILDGFYIGFDCQNEALTLESNITINSTFVGLNKVGVDISQQAFIGNSWDLSVPSELASLNKQATAHQRAQLYLSSPPSVMQWAVGDRCDNSTPSLGQPVGWVCTASGVPGTWVAMANL